MPPEGPRRVQGQCQHPDQAQVSTLARCRQGHTADFIGRSDQQHTPCSQPCAGEPMPNSCCLPAAGSHALRQPSTSLQLLGIAPKAAPAEAVLPMAPCTAGPGLSHGTPLQTSVLSGRGIHWRQPFPAQQFTPILLKEHLLAQTG